MPTRSPDSGGLGRDGPARRTVAAILVEVEGSAPLPLGSAMTVDEDGRIEGSVTGGCVESALVHEAEAILRDAAPARVLAYGISDELAGTVGLTCGGTVHVLVHEPSVAARAARDAFHAAVAAGGPAGIATLLDGERAGAALALVPGDAAPSLVPGEAAGLSLARVGELGVPLLDRNVAADLQGAIEHGRSGIVRYALDGSRLGAEQRVFLHAHAMAPELIVVGAIDFSAELAPLARRLGYRVTICDPRSAFVRAPRFAEHAEVSTAWPQELLAGRALGPRDAVLVFSHDPKLDEPAIRAALASGAGYVGALGSRRTAAARRERLRAAGVSESQLARVHAPCGLDIGPTTAAETAVSVLAELIAHRAGRGGAPLSMTDGPIGGRREARVAGVVLAAGAGRRFGGAKQLASLDGRPLLEHAVAAATATTRLERVFVTLGAHAAEIEAAVDLRGATPVVVAGWEEGQAASLRAGVAAAEASGADAVVVLLGDQPRIAPDAIARVAAAADRGASAARATFAGVPGHPVLLARELFPAVAALRGDGGARELLRRVDALSVPCGPEAVADVDTPAALAALQG